MRKVMIAAALVGTFGFGIAFAQGNPIEERQEIMKGNDKATKVVIAMLKGEKPYDAKAAADAMKSIHDSIGKFVTLFPVGTETGSKTKALPAIWKNKKDFEDWGKQLQEDTTKAQAAAAGGAESMKTALGEVGKSCKGCHDDYRAKETN
jgi:cytochrome c556